MSHPIGTLLADLSRRFVVVRPNECREVGVPWDTAYITVRPWMTPVPVPSNVVVTDTVPDWATDCPIGGLDLPR